MASEARVGWGAGRPCRPPCWPSGRVVLVPCHGTGRRPMHCTGLRAVPARARCLPCRAAHGPCYVSCRRPTGCLEIYNIYSPILTKEVILDKVWVKY